MNIGEIIEKMEEKLNGRLEVQDSTKIPSPEDLPLHQNTGSKLETAAFYIDLRGYSDLLENRRFDTVGRIISAFHYTIARFIKFHSGHIISFMGDGLLALFEPKNNPIKNAVECALKYKYFFKNYFSNEIRERWKIELDYGIGIAYGQIIAIRTGMKGKNDITWVGRCIKDAVKIGDYLNKSNGNIGITHSVYDKLPEGLRRAGDDTECWELTSTESLEFYYTKCWIEV